MTEWADDGDAGCETAATAPILRLRKLFHCPPSFSRREQDTQKEKHHDVEQTEKTAQRVLYTAMLNDEDTAAKDTQILQVFPAYQTTILKLNFDNVGIICSHKTEFLRSQLQKITQHRERTTKLRQKSRCLHKLVQPSHYILLPNFGWLRGRGRQDIFLGLGHVTVFVSVSLCLL